MKYLKDRSKDLSHIAKYYGSIETNSGLGVIFERIKDFDGVPSKSFRYMIANKLLPYEVQEALIEELRVYLFTNQILFVDTSLTNIFCKYLGKEKYKLIIIDGLGAKRFDMKFKLYLTSKLYTKYKVKKQWDKFMVMYDKDVKRVKKGTRPFTRL